MKKIYLIIAQNNYRDEELKKPLHILRKAGYDTKIASPEVGECKGMLGMTITSDIAIKDIVIDDDTVAISIIGGANSPSLMNVPELGTILKDAKEKNILIGAICLGPMVLASFNVFDEGHGTVFPTEDSLAMLKKHKIMYINEAVIVDDNIITANGPQSATPFGQTIVDVLETNTKEKKVPSENT